VFKDNLLRKNAMSSTFTSDPGPTSREEQLVAENQQLSRQLKAFMTKLRQNEEKLERFQALELRFINSQSLFELLEIIVYEYKNASHLDQVTLLLLDPAYELRRFLEEDNIRTMDHPDIRFVERAEDLTRYYQQNCTPYVGSFNSKLHSGVFNASLPPPESVALLPMIRDHQIVGSLNLGSYQKERFLPGSASDFLQRLSTIAAACLRNVTNSERLKHLGLTDVLTGVNNRRFFDQRLFEEIALAKRNQQDLCCLFFDVDHFKRVNDNYGHHSGDIVLREIASLIRMNLRASDVLGRYGGEEFAALLTHTTLEEATEIAERIRVSVASKQFNLQDEQWLTVTISIGIANLPVSNSRIDDVEQLGAQLVKLADECLYNSKRTGRNKVTFEIYQPSELVMG